VITQSSGKLRFNSRTALCTSPSELYDSSASRDFFSFDTTGNNAIAGIRNYQGLASGPISFCLDPSPVCRDGNRTAVLIGYTKGGEQFETEVLARVTMPMDFGL
jgi:hypothetical protein